MIAFFFHQENLIFAIPLGLMFALALLELITTLLGFSLSAIIHTFLPDFHLDLHWDHDLDLGHDLHLGPDLHHDVDLHIDAHGHVAPHIDGHVPGGAHGGAHQGIDLGQVRRQSRIAGFLWRLGVGRIPILILLVLFLSGFGFSGMFFQFMAQKITGSLWNGWLMAVPALAASLVLLRLVGSALTRILPKAGGQATSEKTFIGRVAQISTGTACLGCPAQAKLKDGYGQTHYVMVQPDQKGIVFETGQSVLLIERSGAVFTAVISPIEATDETPPEPPVDDDDDEEEEQGT